MTPDFGIRGHNWSDMSRERFGFRSPSRSRITGKWDKFATFFFFVLTRFPEHGPDRRRPSQWKTTPRWPLPPLGRTNSSQNSSVFSPVYCAPAVAWQPLMPASSCLCLKRVQQSMNRLFICTQVSKESQTHTADIWPINCLLDNWATLQDHCGCETTPEHGFSARTAERRGMTGMGCC